ncbi:Fc.00g001520.m01.CDS01 [Cosmosporella sp. VM-42]
MSFQATLSAAAFAAALQGVFADDPPFTFCKDNTCGDCPVSITSTGGYPDFVVYNSADIFTNQGFGGSTGGGLKTYLDVAQPDPGCTVIVKSPADTTVAGCGYEIGSFSQGGCAQLNLEKSFMVEFCCGRGDCKAAGAKRSVKFGRDGIAGGGAGGVYLKDENGTIITPSQVGPLQTPGRQSCKKNSWVPDAGKEDYTRPADNTQIVLSGVSGPGSITITHTRSQSWTTTIGADFGFADILFLA